MRSAVRGLVCALLLLLAVEAARADTIKITFEELAPGVYTASNFLAGYGIASVTYDRVPPKVYQNDGQEVLPSGTHYFSPGGGSWPSPTDYFNTTLTFASDTPYFSFYHVGFNVYTFGEAGWQAAAYDDLGNLVSSVGVNLAGGLDYPPSSVPTLYTLEGSSSIKSVVFTVNYNYSSTDGTIKVDDFQFETSDVPEPSTLSLLGIGIVGLIAYSRGRKWTPCCAPAAAPR